MGEGNSLKFIQELYEAMGEIIKYLGDGILCIFPDGSEIEAVQCAHHMRTAYADFVKCHNITHDTELEVGINTGEVEVGVVGMPRYARKTSSANTSTAPPSSAIIAVLL